MFNIIDSEKCFEKDIEPYKLMKGEFDVCEPYFKAKKEPVDNSPPVKKRKKKNSASISSVTDVETQKRHEELRPQLTSCVEQLEAVWPEHWKRIKTVTTKSQAIVETETIDFPSIQSMVETAQGKFNAKKDDEEEEPVQLFELLDKVTKDLDLFSIFNIMCINAENKIKLLEITPTCQYLISPKSKFLMGSIANSANQLGQYVNSIGGADLIVMDPPWPNKSVSRSSHYDTQDIYDLYSIPMIDMISTKKDCLVAIWVTNKPKFRHFIINKLFPSWKLECVGEWTWLKVTTQGECIFPLDSLHKKPYEQLIIGRPIHSKNKEIPKTHTIISIPSVRHSRKPPLGDVLLPYLNKDVNEPVCVELFARCLSPGWISWGNECLKFQHLNYFTKKAELNPTSTTDSDVSQI